MTSSLRPGGSTWRWRRIREQVLARDGYRCQLCGEWANTVDHIVPRRDGGTDDPGNLRAACRACNTPSRRPGERFLDRGASTDTTALSVSLHKGPYADDHTPEECGLLLHGWPGGYHSAR